MDLKISFTDLEPNQLNNACWLLISKFSRVLRARDGTVLRMQSKDILSEVLEHKKSANDEQLNALYTQLKIEVRKHLRSREFAAHIPYILDKREYQRQANT